MSSVRQNRYVLLTGGKNNAGDFLIKHRAKTLLSRLRPDRELVDLNGWEPLGEESLETINASQALLLTGGPALQKAMRPRVYPLVSDLSRITVPIIMMGVGWKSAKGNWMDTHKYPMSNDTLELLQRIEADGFLSSVRDYHTLNVLRARGHQNVLMTGDPALYCLDSANGEFQELNENSKVSFSTGVTFVKSPSMEKLTKDSIVRLKQNYPNLTVVFHHSVNPATFSGAYQNKSIPLLEKQLELAEWLKGRDIPYIDISGSEAHLIEHYNQCGLHIGFRVHAHIFMTSVGKPSVLIAEDGRGKALRDVLGGLVFDGYHRYRSTNPHSQTKKRWFIRRRVPNAPYDPYTAAPHLVDDLMQNLSYEAVSGYPRLRTPLLMRQRHFELMQEFLSQLP